MNYIMVVPSINYFFFRYINSENICETYRVNYGIWKKILIILSYIDIFGFFNNLIYGRWYKNLKNNNTIVIFQDGCTLRFKLRKIIKKNNNAYIYLWNPAFDVKYFDKIVLQNNKTYSFDLDDSKKYGLKYIDTFYVPTKITFKPLEFDLLFVGQDKGRKQILDTIKNKFIENGLNPYIYIPQSKDEYLSYDQYLNLLAKSKVLLEIVQKGQSGSTMRMMEALFYKKKIITNNNQVRKFPFYNSSYIYIIEDINNIDFKSIMDFIKIESNFNDKIIEKYDFKNWVLNFGKERKLL